MLTRWKQLLLALGLFLGTSVIGQAQPSPAPRVWSITSDTVSATNITFTVIFNEPVTGVDVSDFSTTGGTTAATITRVALADTDTAYTVTITLKGTNDQIALVLIDDDSIVNSEAIPLGGIGTQNGNAVSPAVTPPPMSIPSTTTTGVKAISAPSTWYDGKIVGAHSSIAMTSHDVPVVSYYDYNNADPKLAMCDQPACVSPRIITLDESGTSGDYTSIALTSTDIPVVSFYHFDLKYLKLATCANARCTAVAVTDVDTLGDVGQYTSIAMTSTNRPVISYWDATNDALKLAVCDDVNCQNPSIYTVDNDGAVGKYTSVALTSNDIPIISYYDETNTNLKLTVCNALDCDTPTTMTIDADGNVGGTTSIAMTSTDNPVITYQDFDNNALKIAVCGNTMCSTKTIQLITLTDSNIGHYSSVALTADDIPVISHYETNNFDLMLTQCTNETCTSHTTSIVDTASDVGSFSSVAVNSQDTPIVAYHDATNGYLKLYQAPLMVDNGRPTTFTKYFPIQNATNYGSTASVAWERSVGADSYEYCIATQIDDCTTWISTDQTNITLTDLIPNTTYYWQVRATNAAGQTFANDEIWNFSVFTPRITDDRIYVGYDSDIRITQNDTPIVSFRDANNDFLQLAICDSLVCLDPIVRTVASTGGSMSLALTATDIPVISYSNYDTGDLYLAVCNDADCDTPTNTLIDDSPGVTGWESSLALTSTGIPVISYIDINQNLHLAICDTLACANPTIRSFDPADVLAQYTDLALTSDNQPVIVFYDTIYSDLKLAVCDTLACDAPRIVTIDSYGSVGASPSMTLSSDNEPIIAYSDLSAGTFKLAMCDTLTCADPVIRVLDTANPWAGFHSSVALTSDELPIISYYDDATSDLHVVYCHTTQCRASNTQILDSIGIVGPTNAVALTSHDVAVISYVDSDLGNLKIDVAPHTVYKGEPIDFTTTRPINNSNISGSSPISLQWQSVAGATGYEYCVSTSTTCTSWVDIGDSTSVTVSGLAHNTTYFWQVRASNAAGTTVANRGVPQRFTVVFAPTTFNKAAPANNAKNQKTTVTLSWAASTRATSYEYCIALTAASCTNWKSTGANRTATVTGLAKNKTYFWQVRAKNTAGTVLATGSHWKFTTAR